LVIKIIMENSKQNLKEEEKNEQKIVSLNEDSKKHEHDKESFEKLSRQNEKLRNQK